MGGTTLTTENFLVGARTGGDGTASPPVSAILRKSSHFAAKPANPLWAWDVGFRALFVAATKNPYKQGTFSSTVRSKRFCR